MTDADQTHADIEACDRALSELVGAVVAHDLEREAAREHGKSIRVRWFGETSIERLAFESLTTDPVRHALREGVKRLGREIYRLGGGTGALMDSLDRVAGLDPANAGRRGAIINSAFDGIGIGDDRWWS